MLSRNIQEYIPPAKRLLPIDPRRVVILRLPVAYAKHRVECADRRYHVDIAPAIPFSNHRLPTILLGAA